jgi:[histone H3]-trimethyl-L-lysine9/36 demethylase
LLEERFMADAGTTCQIFRPTLKEFESFPKYIQSVEGVLDLRKHGIIKVIPPEGWFQRQYDESQINQIIIRNPVAQHVSRTGKEVGVYTVNIVDQSDLTIAAYKEFAQKISHNFASNDFEMIEKSFWRSIGSNVDGLTLDPLYGADMVGSLFYGNPASSWNVDQLETPLKLLQHTLPGVNNAMLYVGCWRSLFAFHTEDMELNSINYLHLGSPKVWYSIPPYAKQRFESLAQSFFAEDFLQCSQFLRHKTHMISPKKLREKGIPFHTVIQLPGEFVITFPEAYHSGFNQGFNIAEATNFMTPRWFDIGRRAKVCVCEHDSVRVNPDAIETLLWREQTRGEDERKQSGGVKVRINIMICTGRWVSGIM